MISNHYSVAFHSILGIKISLRINFVSKPNSYMNYSQSPYQDIRGAGRLCNGPMPGNFNFPSYISVGVP